MSDPILDALERYSGVDRDAEEGFRRYKALTAEVAALRVSYEQLRAGFITHRTATHEIKPKHCETCRESDALLATDPASHGAAILEAGRQMRKYGERVVKGEGTTQRYEYLSDALDAWDRVLGTAGREDGAP